LFLTLNGERKGEYADATVAARAVSNGKGAGKGFVVWWMKVVGLSNVRDFVVIQTLDIVLLHEGFDILLDIGNLGREAGLDLLDNLLHELDVLHLLARLHDADNGGLYQS
jgi:hypothetical protein